MIINQLPGGINVTQVSIVGTGQHNVCISYPMFLMREGPNIGGTCAPAHSYGPCFGWVTGYGNGSLPSLGGGVGVDCRPITPNFFN